MKTASKYYLSRLVRAHGSNSQTARMLGITPRYMRRIRSQGMPSSCNRMLLTAGKLHLLRELLHELRHAGVLTNEALATAWLSLRADSSAKDESPCLHALPHNSATTPPKW